MLEAQRALGPDWSAWLDRLPARTEGLLEEWELVREGDQAWNGHCSLVLPVRTRDGEPAALKVSFDGDEESRHEALALQHWGGRGAVRLLRADPARRALLLERLATVDLGSAPALQACEVVAGLYPLLHRPAMPQLSPVAAFVKRWVAALAEVGRDAPLPRRMVDQAVALGRDLVVDSARPEAPVRVLHGDLHYGNVLAGARAPWLAIDPKAMAGDPHYEPAPMLWNRWGEVLDTGDVRTATRARFHTLVDVAGLDEDRARDWVVVRMLLNAHWTVQDAERAGRRLDREERDWLTMCLSVAKAVQD